MSQRIRLTNAEWDAVELSVAQRIAELAAGAPAEADADSVAKEIAALTRSLDKIAAMMRPTAQRPASSAVSARRGRG